MKKNTCELEKGLENSKNRTQTGHTTGHTPGGPGEVVPFPTAEKAPKSKPATRAGKDQQAYWQDKVRPRIIRGKPTSEFYCRLFEAGREAWICCDTSNRTKAARKARDLYLRMKAIGLPALLDELRPEKKPDTVCTVASYVEAARELADVRAQTFAEYQGSLRRVVAGVCKIKAKSDRHADRDEWRKKVDAVRLDRITPQAVRAWREKELERARKRDGEAAKDRRGRTLSSHLRDAKALFSEKLVKEIANPTDKKRRDKALKLPEELPFSGITAKATTRQFECDLDPHKLYKAADELDPDTRTAFDLLLCGGLRRGEADALPWQHVNLEAGTVKIDVTETFRPKSETSKRTVHLPPDVVERLKERRESDPRAKLVLQPRPMKKPTKKPGTKRAAYEYRAKAWKPLTAWLRAQGMADLTPLHALRKLSGSFVYAIGGLEAARKHLGHRDIQTTARSYIQSGPVTVDFSKSQTPAPDDKEQ